MPQIFKIGAYLIYFWSNEGEPLEPIHVHVAEGYPSENSTKIWITKSGKCLLCNNNSRIPGRKLRDIMDIVEARHFEIEKKWLTYFKEIYYYC
ncbi:MAG: DUF4160 domain-containing protein [Lachnospiraceae bacterium]|nr:DUF4160 domain-containing protein [Lachnospiraceae bacterium]